MIDSRITAPLIEQLVDLSRRAGAAIMAIYNDKGSYDIAQKSDDSPLTAADLASHRLISDGLREILPLPIISEEGALPPFADRHLWDTYWLVDPLDGTKEFIAGNGQFTVNIALIQRNCSVLGVVHVPVTDTTYLGVVDASDKTIIGAFKYTQGAGRQPIHVRPLGERFLHQEPLTVLLSHRHCTQATIDLMAAITHNWPGEIETTNAGSSLKFCFVAEGRADFYPRLAPTSEWDTAAAHAVLEAAGGQIVCAAPDFQPLQYNTSDDLLNPHFFALGDRHFCWEKLLVGDEISNKNLKDKKAM